MSLEGRIMKLGSDEEEHFFLSEPAPREEIVDFYSRKADELKQKTADLSERLRNMNPRERRAFIDSFYAGLIRQENELIGIVYYVGSESIDNAINLIKEYSSTLPGKKVEGRDPRAKYAGKINKLSEIVSIGKKFAEQERRQKHHIEKTTETESSTVYTQLFGIDPEKIEEVFHKIYSGDNKTTTKALEEIGIPYDKSLEIIGDLVNTIYRNSKREGDGSQYTVDLGE